MRCGIVLEARNFEFLARTRCKAKGCQRPRGSGIQIEVAFVEGGRQVVAAGLVVLADRRSKVPGCKEIAVVTLNVVEGSVGDQNIVRAAVARRLCTGGIEVLLMTTGSCRHEKVRCKVG